MNHITAVVTQIAKESRITLVSYDANGMSLRSMGLGMNLPVQVGSHVVLGVKATHVAIAKQFEGEISFSNCLKADVQAIELGELLCNVTLRVGQSEIESIFTRETCERMRLREGDQVVALMKASDLSLLKVLT